MNSWILILLICVSLCSCANLDIFQWPKYSAQSKSIKGGGGSGALGDLRGLKDRAMRKLNQGIREIKSRMRGFGNKFRKGNGGTRGRGYPTSRPSHYGAASSSNVDTGYFRVVQESGHDQSSYSSLDAPFGITQPRLQPSPVHETGLGDESLSYQVNAPLSAVMALDSLLNQNTNNAWTPIYANSSFSGGKQLATGKQLVAGADKGKQILSLSNVLNDDSQRFIRSGEVGFQETSEANKVTVVNGGDVSKEALGKALGILQPIDNTISIADGDIIKQFPIGLHGDGHQSFRTLMGSLNLHIFIRLIHLANLDAMLTTNGDFTIFAPLDSGFGLLPVSIFKKLENNTEKLREVILFHVVPGVISLIDVRHEMSLSTASPGSKNLRLNIYNFGADLQPIVTVNGARILNPDMKASNGMVHVIDRVLYPRNERSIMQLLRECDTFSGANVAVTSSGVSSVLSQGGPYTFFVPTTEAFSRVDNSTVHNFLNNLSLLQGTYFSEGLRDGAYLPTLLEETELQVKVSADGYARRLSGVGLNARVIKADIPAKNGVLHVIDRVLRPESDIPICGYF